MKIKRLVTEIFYNELETRGSHPSLFDCSDNYRYVVKHSQHGRNFYHLINELIASQLAQMVNIPTPEFALIDVNENILPDDYIFAYGKPSGLGFGSQFLSGTIKTATSLEEIVSYTSHKKFNIIEDLIKITAFDIWLRNTDRSVNNPNLLIQETGNKIRL